MIKTKYFQTKENFFLLLNHFEIFENHIFYTKDSLKDLKESGLPNWAKTPDINGKESKQTAPVIEEEAKAKKEPFSKRRDSSESKNGNRKDSSESNKQQKVENKTPQTPIAPTPKKEPSKDRTFDKSPLKTPPSPSKVPRSPSKSAAAPGSPKKTRTAPESPAKIPGSPAKIPGSPAKQRRGLVRSESAQVDYIITLKLNPNSYIVLDLKHVIGCEPRREEAF